MYLYKYIHTCVRTCLWHYVRVIFLFLMKPFFSTESVALVNWEGTKLCPNLHVSGYYLVKRGKIRGLVIGSPRHQEILLSIIFLFVLWQLRFVFNPFLRYLFKNKVAFWGFCLLRILGLSHGIFQVKFFKLSEHRIGLCLLEVSLVVEWVAGGDFELNLFQYCLISLISFSINKLGYF